MNAITARIRVIMRLCYLRESRHRKRPCGLVLIDCSCLEMSLQAIYEAIVQSRDKIETENNSLDCKLFDCFYLSLSRVTKLLYKMRKNII